jgi:hypothetical protein
MRCSTLLAISVVGITVVSGPDRSVADPPTSAQAGCRECDDVISRVVQLLPERPEAIVVIDADRTSPALKRAIEHAEAFVTVGLGTVCLKKQAPMFQRTLNGPGIWDYALASVIWHEMAHIAGADEPEAQRREEELWTQFISSRKVEASAGARYLQLLTKRHPKETRTADARR